MNPTSISTIKAEPFTPNPSDSDYSRPVFTSFAAFRDPAWATSWRGKSPADSGRGYHYPMRPEEVLSEEELDELKRAGVELYAKGTGLLKR